MASANTSHERRSANQPKPWITPDSERPSRSSATTTTQSPGRAYSSRAIQTRAARSRAGEPVAEDPLTPRARERISLRIKRLVPGTHSRVPDD